MLSWTRRLLPLFAFLLALPIACQDVKAPKKEAAKDGPGREEVAGGEEQAELEDHNVRFGMPAPAGKEHQAHLIERPQYVVSYNGKTRDPNWVAWRLRKEDIGHAKRGAFQPDPLLPANISHVTSSVYDNSGFDRGHQCPAQDRSATQENMDATFYTTNIIPQAPMCNQRGWERLESYCRDLTKDGHVLWICCGPAGVGGEGKDGRKDIIGNSRIEVIVPEKVWKVILVLPSEDARPTKQSRTIGVIMPNDQSVDFEWAKYRVSVAEVEKLTGLSFWPAIPRETATVLKEKVDEVHVRVPKQKGGE